MSQWRCEACNSDTAIAQSYAGCGPVIICNVCGRDWNEFLRINHRPLLSQFILFGATFAKLRNGFPTDTGLEDEAYRTMDGYMDTENELLVIWRSWCKARKKQEPDE